MATQLTCTKAWPRVGIQIMGVLNVTPDSFYDGGRYSTLDRALLQAQQMAEEGVDIIDIGGESTRPHAVPVSPEEECRRVIPVITHLQRAVGDIPLSIDSRHPAVIRAALDAGVAYVNDINALQDPQALSLVAEYGVPVCLMHMQGTPQSMQQAPRYENVRQEVYAFLAQRIEACLQAGIQQAKICVDPGFGFGKTAHHNFDLLAHLNFFSALGCPILVGLSRKNMFSEKHTPPEQRLSASLAGAVIAALQGARIIRTHDVGPTKQAIAVATRVLALQQNISSEVIRVC